MAEKSMGEYVLMAAERAGVDVSGSKAAVAKRLALAVRDREHVLTIALRLCAENAGDPDFVREIVSDALDGTMASLFEREAYESRKEVSRLRREVARLKKELDAAENRAFADTSACSGDLDSHVESVIGLFGKRLCPPLPEVRPENKTVRRVLKRLVGIYPDFSGMAAWEEFFDKVEHSPFLLGKAGDGTFIASLSWLAKEKNFNNVIDGKYMDKTKSSLSADNVEAVISLFNEMLCPPLHPVREDNRTARTSLLACSAGNPVRSTVEWWRDRFFPLVAGSRFLMGRAGKDWRADFHWLIKEENMDKVIGRVYDDKRPEAEVPAKVVRAARYLVDSPARDVEEWCSENDVDLDQMNEQIRSIRDGS